MKNKPKLKNIILIISIIIIVLIVFFDFNRYRGDPMKPNSKIMSELLMTRAQIESLYEKSQSYVNICNDSIVSTNIEEAKKTIKNGEVKCFSNSNNWVVSAKIKNYGENDRYNLFDYYCVDSSGSQERITTDQYLNINENNIRCLQFPPSNTECFDSFMNAVDSGYADGFHIPAFNFSDISYFRCASKIGFDQYEISGTDKEGRTFYIHKDEGGMASSGADTIFNLCYKQDNLTIRNEKLNGREAIKKEGTCFWTEDFPQNPTSTYEFKR